MTDIISILVVVGLWWCLNQYIETDKWLAEYKYRKENDWWEGWKP